MRTATTLGTFGLGLTVVLAASIGVGRAVGPVGTVGANAATATSCDTHDTHSGAAVVAAVLPQGLSAAYGHLVSLREGDLAYLHTHPNGTPDDGRTPAGPDVAFGVDVPTPGTYLIHPDFRHDGVVRTAAFVATATSAR